VTDSPTTSCYTPSYLTGLIIISLVEKCVSVKENLDSRVCDQSQNLAISGSWIDGV